MNKQGQGALEYLLLIGGAVLVASIVIALITGTTSGQKDPRALAKCAILTDCAKCIADTTNKCQAVIRTATGGERTTSVAAGCTLAASETFKYCGTTQTV